MTESDSQGAELSFGAAMQELETILRRVESDEIDIDELAEELKHAAGLLETCRAKIRRAEVEVSQIVQSLDPEASEPPPEPPPEPQPQLESQPRQESPAPLPDDAPEVTSLGETASLFESGD